MLSGKNYKTVKNTALKILNFKNKNLYYTTASDLKKLGFHYSIKIGGCRRTFKNWHSTPNIAILAINYREASDTWHWALFLRTENEEYVLDPLNTIKSEKRTDLNRISKNTKWFIPVEYT